MSEGHPVSNLDTLKVGGTSLQLHIHPGTETCDQCEPGQVLAKIQQQQKEEQAKSTNSYK